MSGKGRWKRLSIIEKQRMQDTMEDQQEPKHREDEQPTPSSITALRLAELQAALAEGWEIVEPIFARPLWSSVTDTASAFHFVLRHEQRVQLLTIPRERAVECFIAERHLAVDEA